MATPDQIIAAARTRLGAPFRHRGRGPVGYDCLGLLIATFKDLQLVPAAFDFTDYSLNVSQYELEQHLDASPFLERVNWRQAQPADILLLRFHTNLPASHLILITTRQGDALWGVHAARRFVVEQRIAHLERCVAAYRLKEVEHG